MRPRVASRNRAALLPVAPGSLPTECAALTTACLIFPHQLFAEHPALTDGPTRVVMVQEPLFFGDPVYPAKFHKQKLAFHHATMACHATRLHRQGHEVEEVAYEADAKLLHRTVARLASEGVTGICVAYAHDFILEKRLAKACADAGVELEVCDTPMFLNTPQLNREYRDGKRRWFMADFYQFQRRRLNILIEPDGTPTGGKWSFDHENRKPVPKSKRSDVPQLWPRNATPEEQAARQWVRDNFEDNYGSVDTLWYPIDHDAAADWLAEFLAQRFHLFGDYEDAILRGESLLWHGLLTPMLNVGLLTPRQVVNETLAYAQANDVPLNALEGFIRQIIGWREFMHATYCDLGVTMRTTNHWNHTRKMPESFWEGTTGIAPIDETVGRIQETAYAHHIERLMVLGGFFFLNRFDPDDVYRWFMEMFIDAYDWVMVPNAYAMSQNSTGGSGPTSITTKPYFSGSAYVKKMSDWTGAARENEGDTDWAATWDALYWTWIADHADDLEKNPRWAMMVATARKMDGSKMAAHRRVAQAWMQAW